MSLESCNPKKEDKVALSACKILLLLLSLSATSASQTFGDIVSIRGRHFAKAHRQPGAVSLSVVCTTVRPHSDDVSMPSESHYIARAARGHQCRLLPRSFGSFLQQRIRTRVASQRVHKHCVRAKLDPSEATESIESSKQQDTGIAQEPETEAERTKLQSFLYPDASELSNSEMPIWDHLDELRERILIAALAAGGSILTCFCFSKDLVVFLEAPVAEQGVRFLQLSPGEFFFTTFKVAGYAGLLLATPTVLYEIVAWVFPGLTTDERKQLAPIVFGSSILFYLGLVFAYQILTPAALQFFVSYADGAVESLWSIDQYFEFVLVLLLSTGLSFQVPVIQVLLGNTGIVTSKQMFSQWRYVVVGATVAAAVLTPSTDPFTQTLLAVPLIGLYLGGAACVRLIEGQRASPQQS